MRIFENDLDRSFYLSMLREHSDKYRMQVISWCLMSNHVHIVAVPESESSLAEVMGNSHRAYSSMFNKRHDTKGFLFAGRFYSTPMDRPHLYAAVKYILRNPVRAGLVDDPFVYPWSSVLFNSGRSDSDRLVLSNDLLDWIVHWDEYLADDPTEMKDLRLCTRTGRPCGNDAFIEYAEHATGRKLKRARPGRKPQVKVSP